ncbi:MAG: hypothetical protein O3C10_05915 [Chloroflexi bacterium]|nr:hypothetical protein [Chloroflexota bacterium]
MKITDIATLVVGNPWKYRVFVIVETGSACPESAKRETGVARLRMWRR